MDVQNVMGSNIQQKHWGEHWGMIYSPEDECSSPAAGKEYVRGAVQRTVMQAEMMACCSKSD